MEEIVRFVFEDVQVVFFCHFIDGFSSREGLRGAGGVLAAWDGIENERFAGTVVLRGVPVGQDLVEIVGEEAFGIHFDAFYLYSKGQSGFNGGSKGVFLAKDPVAPLTESAECHV